MESLGVDILGRSASRAKSPLSMNPAWRPAGWMHFQRGHVLRSTQVP